MEREPVPMRLLVSPVPCEVELLRGYEAVCELFGEGPMEVVVCPGGYPFVDSLGETELTPELVGTLVIATELPVGPVLGSEEFVVGNGVISVAPTEVLVRPVAGMEEFVRGYGVMSVALELSSDPKVIDELEMLNELFVGLAVGTVMFVNGKVVIPVLREPVVFAGAVVGIGTDPVLEVDVPVSLD